MPPSDATHHPYQRDSRLVAEPVAANVQAICLEGEFDLTCANEIVAAAAAALAEGSDIILDLSSATFIDSTVLHAIATIDRDATQRARTVVVQMGSGQIVRQVLAITRLNEVLACCETRDEALSAVRSAASVDGGGSVSS